MKSFFYPVLILSLSLALNADAMTRHRIPAQPEPSPSVSLSPSPVPSVSPAPLPSGVPALSFSPVTGTADEIARVKAAELVDNGLAASKCFEDFFLKRSLVQTSVNGGPDLSNAQVIAFIRAAHAAAPVVYYYANNGTVGYRQPPDSTIYVNRKFHNAYSVCSEASGNGHEMLHVLGFDHDYKRTARRPYSVPYSWNAMSDVCCPQLYPQYE